MYQRLKERSLAAMMPGSGSRVERFATCDNYLRYMFEYEFRVPFIVCWAFSFLGTWPGLVGTRGSEPPALGVADVAVKLSRCGLLLWSGVQDRDGARTPALLRPSMSWRSAS